MGRGGAAGGAAAVRGPGSLIRDRFGAGLADLFDPLDPLDPPRVSMRRPRRASPPADRDRGLRPRRKPSPGSSGRWILPHGIRAAAGVNAY